jgi:uncharacterized protein
MNAAQHILIFGVRCYRWVISPAKAFVFEPLGRCRFTPSCSEYALEAVGRRGALAGSWLAIKRIGRCHPWGGCGADPVPEEKSKVQSLKSGAEDRQCSPVSRLPSRLQIGGAGTLSHGIKQHGS